MCMMCIYIYIYTYIYICIYMYKIFLHEVLKEFYSRNMLVQTKFSPSPPKNFFSHLLDRTKFLSKEKIYFTYLKINNFLHLSE